MFKQFLKDKRQNLSENEDFSKIRFNYYESENVEDLLKIYAKDKNVDTDVISKALEEICVIFDSMDYSEKNSASLHEDLIDCGFVLGYVASKIPGKIFGIKFDGVRYFFVGNEKEISDKIKSSLNKYLKL